jgi:prepilin-type N-terminal cleavage/methylation domain-containing protein
MLSARHINSGRFSGGTRGLTLVEVLATTVLLGLVASLLATSFGDASQVAKTRALVRALVDLDARARLAARAGSDVSIALDTTGRRAVAVRRIEADVLSEVVWPEGTTVELRAPSASPVKAVHFDANGTSVDYVVVVHSQSRDARIDVSGITGWTQTSEVRP